MGLIVKNSKHLIKEMWSAHPTYFLFVFLYTVSTVTLAFAIIEAPTIILSMAMEGAVDMFSIITLFTVLLTSVVIQRFSKYKFTPMGYSVRYKMLLDVMTTNLSIPFESFDQPDVMENIWVISSPLSSAFGVQGYFLQSGLFFGNFFIVVLCCGILYKLHPLLMIVVVVFIIFSVIFAVSMNQKVDKAYQERAKEFRKDQYLSQVSEDFSYGKEIRVFELEELIIDKIDENNNELMSAFSNQFNLDANYRRFYGIYQFVRDSILYLTLVTLYLKGLLSIPEFSSYIVLVYQLNVSIEQMIPNILTIFASQNSMSKMFDWLESERQTDEGEEVKLDMDWVISFEHVDFKYPGSDTYVYKDLNFTIEKGKKIAVVGLNGSGKTTLLKLLMRLYEPTSGEIKLNGRNVKEYKIEEYMALFAPVFQEINIYATTLKDNIVFNQEFDENRVEQALRDARIYEKVSSIPNYYDKEMTRYLEEDGLQLSGGESQRLAMARALYYNRPIIILDEPTSALDAIAEYDFYHNISNVSKDKTILFISHRLASTSFCDETILIEDETIKERGTHETLMDLRGRYYELYVLQSKYYKEGDIHEE